MSDKVSVRSTPMSLFAEAKELKATALGKAIDLSKEALVLAEEDKNYELEFEIRMFLAITYRIQGVAFACVEQLNKAYRLVNHQFYKDHIKLSKVYREYGSLYCDNFCDYTTGLDYSMKSLSLNNPDLKLPLHINIGCQYVMLGNYEKAAVYLTKAKSMTLKVGDELLLSYIYENFAELYKRQRDFPKAIVACKEGIAAAERGKDIKAVAHKTTYIHCCNLIQLAEIYLLQGAKDLIPPILDQVYEKSLPSKLQSCWSEAALIEGTMLLNSNQIDEFKALFEKATSFCTQHSLLDDKEEWLNKMIVLSEKQDLYKEALSYSKKLIANKKNWETKRQAVNITKILENKEIEILGLQNSHREMKMQKEQLEQFAYIVAHDLKTPLSNISNFTGLFSRNYGDKVDKENKYYLDFVLDNSKKLHLMFDQLQRYISSGVIEENNVACNLEKILAHVIQKNKNTITVKNASIKWKGASDIMMNSKHLKTILDRMIDNSLKFSKVDIAPIIFIEVQESSEVYLFSISDNGIGIEDIYQHKIFDLYKQLDKIKYQGVGMGLPICKKIINAYGGKVSIATNEAMGVTFNFDIPKQRNFL